MVIFFQFRYQMKTCTLHVESLSSALFLEQQKKNQDKQR